MPESAVVVVVPAAVAVVAAALVAVAAASEVSVMAWGLPDSACSWYTNF